MDCREVVCSKEKSLTFSLRIINGLWESLQELRSHYNPYCPIPIFCSNWICISWWFTFKIPSNLYLTVTWTHLSFKPVHTLMQVICVTNNKKVRWHGVKTDKMDTLVANVCITFCSDVWQTVFSWSAPPLLFFSAAKSFGALMIWACWTMLS